MAPLNTPYLSEKSFELAVRVLEKGGVIASGGEEIRNIPPNASEAEIVAALANVSTTFIPSPGTAAIVSSIRDVDVFIDSDNQANAPQTSPSYNDYFRISQGIDSALNIDKLSEIFTLTRERTDPADPAKSVVCTFGPRLTWFDNPADDVPVTLNLGGTDGDYYTSIDSTSTGLLISRPAGDVDFDVTLGDITALAASGGINLSAPLGDITLSTLNTGTSVTLKTADIYIQDTLGVARGGFNGLLFGPQFFVGSNPTVPASISLLVEGATSGVGSNGLAATDFRIRTNRNATSRIFIGGSEALTGTAATINQSTRLAIGGDPTFYNPLASILWGNSVGPSTYAPQALSQVSLLVVSPPVSSTTTNHCVFRTYHRQTDAYYPDDEAHFVNHHFEWDVDQLAPPHPIRLFSITARNTHSSYQPDEHQVLFSVREDGELYAIGGINSSAADLAEAFASVDKFSPETVVCAGSSGKAEMSSSYADPCVLGVVSTKPGFKLGIAEDTPHKDMPLMVALSGTVPVKVSTSHGAIEVGNLLVSDEGGKAAKAPEDPAPGTVIGKALESLSQPGEDVVNGTIKMLVMQR